MYNIEDLHESGKLPTRYYNQINNNSAQENYNASKTKKQNNNENFIYIVRNMLTDTVNTALNEILNKLKI